MQFSNLSVKLIIEIRMNQRKMVMRYIYQGRKGGFINV